MPPANADLPSLPAKVAKAANRAECQRELDRWCAAINRLELQAPAQGLSPARWRTLFDCSHWWMRNYAVQAARDGWRTGDVFGIRPGLPGQGGLIDQLGICRTLLMADGGARWRSWGIIGTYAAGAYPLLPPFWEGDHGTRQS